ncbi:hypothetical protein TARUN_8022 [Trichoderma arundinaceum]|uniref:NmrA-like domain-containing protein n=1 Tax=Trichoderma arundinaceum TaxID=490622 RepID=A0A395NDP8_TRIAR|nr:hypothetical protein TARUN_8022 [Trichoderma arundinaceum]
MALRIAVAGATGDLGLPIVKALLTAGYYVTALTREGSSNASKLPSSSNLSVIEVDYSSVHSLATALKDHNVVISTLTSTSVNDQNPLIDGAITAGVSRFIPSEFGSDVTNSKRNQLPVFEGKVKTHEYLKTVVAKTPDFSYTVICTGAFLDWGLHGFLVNVPGHEATVYNGGDIPFAATNLDTIGKAIVGVIQHLPETANRPVYIQDAIVTQNSLIRYAKEKDGVEWDITNQSTEAMFADSLVKMANGIADWSVMQPFVFSSVFGEGYGQDFSNHLDNKLLGLKGLTDAEVRALVESLL